MTLYVLDGFDVLSGRLLNALEEPDAFFADAQVQYFMLGNWFLLFTSRSGASAVPDFLDQPGWQPISGVIQGLINEDKWVLGVCSQAFQYFATEMLQGTNK